MLRYFIQKAMEEETRNENQHRVPSGAVQQKAEGCGGGNAQAGAQEVLIVPEPVAAAIGSEIDSHETMRNMIVDIGGGTTDIAVISLQEPLFAIRSRFPVRHLTRYHPLCTENIQRIYREQLQRQ